MKRVKQKRIKVSLLGCLAAKYKRPLTGSFVIQLLVEVLKAPL